VLNNPGLILEELAQQRGKNVNQEMLETELKHVTKQLWSLNKDKNNYSSGH
jgi:hypothetical protein